MTMTDLIEETNPAKGQNEWLTKKRKTKYWSRFKFISEFTDPAAKKGDAILGKKSQTPNVSIAKT